MASTLANWLFDPAGLTPHGFCLLWEPGLIWTYAVSDIGIGIAYFTIPLALTLLARKRRDLVFRPVFWLFATFIMLCGASHWIDVLTLWIPAYGLEAVFKACTAVVSLFTAVAVWWLMPKLLELPSPSQLRQVNNALRESEARFRASFEHSPVPLYTLDGIERITDASQSWLELLGLTRAEAIGRAVREFQVPGSATSAAEDRRSLMSRSTVHDVERRFRRSDGSVIEALVSARTERQGDGYLVICVLIDITARRRAEEALRRSEEKLRQAQKMEAVGQLTGGIAHDFNNMLQAIGGGLDLMESRISQGRAAEAQAYIGSARQALSNAAALTNRLLAFSRRQALEPRPVSPTILVRGMEDLLQRTLGPEIELDLYLPDAVWQAQCDPNQLENALLNLAINARDAMSGRGTLAITTANRVLREADLVDQDDVQPGDFVEIAVADTGMGMTEDVMKRVFEPFFTTKPSGYGTGLGLSQLYGFVRQSDGIVRLASEPGVGTIVRMLLPRHDAARDDAPPLLPATAMHGLGSAISSSSVAGRCVLVVEDHDSIRALVGDALRDIGCRVLEAKDGPSGLRTLQSRVAIDLLVTDVGLPGLNGRQLADAARVTRPEMAVLLITGYAGTALEDLRLAPGMEILRKPFKLDALLEQVRRMLNRATVS